MRLAFFALDPKLHIHIRYPLCTACSYHEHWRVLVVQGHGMRGNAKHHTFLALIMTQQKLMQTWESGARLISIRWSWCALCALFVYLGGFLWQRDMGFRFQAKVKHTTFLASFMTLQSLLQRGMAVRGLLPLPWTHDADLDGSEVVCAHFVTQGGFLW